jgi:hypothetical protein
MKVEYLNTEPYLDPDRDRQYHISFGKPIQKNREINLWACSRCGELVATIGHRWIEETQSFDEHPTDWKVVHRTDEPGRGYLVCEQCWIQEET